MWLLVSQVQYGIFPPIIQASEKKKAWKWNCFSKLFFSGENKKKKKKSKYIVKEMFFAKNMSLGPRLASQVALRETVDKILYFQ